MAKIYDKKTLFHRETEILAWKKQSKMMNENHENFESYYMIRMTILHYDGDRNVFVKFNNKYKIIKYIDLVLSDGEKSNNFVINGAIYCGESDLNRVFSVDKFAKIIEPKNGEING